MYHFLKIGEIFSYTFECHQNPVLRIPEDKVEDAEAIVENKAEAEVMSGSAGADLETGEPEDTIRVETNITNSTVENKAEAEVMSGSKAGADLETGELEDVRAGTIRVETNITNSIVEKISMQCSY